MGSQFQNSMYYNILMGKKHQNITPISIMGGVSGSYFLAQDKFMEQSFVVFDFETTGLDTRNCRIIEIGAIKYKYKKEVARFSQLINQPFIQNVLPEFHDFLRGSIGVAHNAEYDLAMLFHESNRLGISCDYTVICTLKLARAFLKLESRNLDSLSKHYGLQFESRHRSIGDILVTAEILWKLLEEHPELQTMTDLLPFREFIAVN